MATFQGAVGVTWQAVSREDAAADIDSEGKWLENVITFQHTVCTKMCF
jgi:hypothetical protein